VSSQCPACKGDGRVPIGEHFVTRDMAIDAGEREMEGMSMGVEYGDCRECGGTGQAPPIEIEKLKDRLRWRIGYLRGDWPAMTEAAKVEPLNLTRDALAVIERLQLSPRLSEEERDALGWAVCALTDQHGQPSSMLDPRYAIAAATLRKMLGET